MIERRPFGQTIVYTSAQAGSEEYDKVWKTDFGVTVIRDRAKILLPTPRVARNVARIIKESDIQVAAFGAAVAYLHLVYGVIICTFVPVKQVNCIPAHQELVLQRIWDVDGARLHSVSIRQHTSAHVSIHQHTDLGR